MNRVDQSSMATRGEPRLPGSRGPGDFSFSLLVDRAMLARLSRSVRPAQYIHWFVYTAEDRKFFHDEPDISKACRASHDDLKPNGEIADPDTALARHPESFAVRS